MSGTRFTVSALGAILTALKLTRRTKREEANELRKIVKALYEKSKPIINEAAEPKSEGE